MNEVTIIKHDKGDFELSPKIVRDYLLPVDTKITDNEIYMFMQLCVHQKLNPFIGEAYLIKYGSRAAQRVVGKEVFTKRAANSKFCDGWDSGVVLWNNEKKEERFGKVMLPGEKLIGGWVKVKRKDWSMEKTTVAPLWEYQKKDGKGEVYDGTWKSMPATMIEKCAVVKGLREAFPDELQGLYVEDEIGNDIIPDTSIEDNDENNPLKEIIGGNENG